MFAWGFELQTAATAIATTLRRQGKTVDLVLESKKPKWVYKHADRLGVRFVCMVAPAEWANGQASDHILEIPTS